MAKRATLSRIKAPTSVAKAPKAPAKSAARAPQDRGKKAAAKQVAQGPAKRAPKATAPQRKKAAGTNHGGRREGAGRKPQLDRNGERIHASRLPRPPFKRNQPLVVRVVFVPAVKDLRSAKLLPGIQAALAQSDHPGSFQVVEHHIMARELRLVVRAADNKALSAGMRGLGARCSHAVNRVHGTRGSALRDRFELTVAATPAQASKLLRQ